MPYTVCYAATYHNNKLYVADFCGGGIIYSEDFGKTWKNTDLSSLKYVAEEEDGSSVENTENVYQMVSYKVNYMPSEYTLFSDLTSQPINGM